MFGRTTSEAKAARPRFGGGFNAVSNAVIVANPDDVSAILDCEHAAVIINKHGTDKLL